jgi:hypothetical protein
MQEEIIHHIKHYGKIIVEFDSDGNVIDAIGKHIVRYWKGNACYFEEAGSFGILRDDMAKCLADYINRFKEDLKKAEERQPKMLLVKCQHCYTIIEAYTVDNLLDSLRNHIRDKHKLDY